jgi:hypothetical protein
MTKLRVVAFVPIFAVSFAAAAQAVPPPPKSDTGPSLEVTMKYIQDKLGGLAVFYVEKSKKEDDSDTQNSEKILQAHADPATCTLTFQKESTMSWTYYGQYKDHDIRVTTQTSDQLSLRDVQKVGVQNTDRYSSLVIYTAGGSVSEDEHQEDCHNERCQDGPPKHKQLRVAYFSLSSEDTANRVAKAMLHAVELCGGGDKDPFATSGRGSISGSSSEPGPSTVPAASAPTTGSAPVAEPVPSSQPQNQPAQEAAQPNWCANSTQVSYTGDSLDANRDINLWFSLSEGHTDRYRFINMYYTVTYSCYQRGPYTKSEQDSEALNPGEAFKSIKRVFIAHECPLPDHGYPHTDRIQITRINCN